jgi:hypothetical protein
MSVTVDNSLTCNSPEQALPSGEVDEAQAYKNLAVTSHIAGVRGDGSKRAEDLLMKLDWLRRTHGHRVATFATATPIANSVAEMYVIQRRRLRERPVDHGLGRLTGLLPCSGEAGATIRWHGEVREWPNRTYY